MHSQTTAAAEPRTADFCETAAMLQSPQGMPDYPAEVSEFREIARVLADDPTLAMRRLLRAARKLCRAGTAGVSLLRQDAAGRALVRWELLSGKMACHEGTAIPQDASPCGLCISAGTTVLVSRPERFCAPLCAIRPAICEDLVAPLYDSTGAPLGTLWVAHHQQAVRFSSDDARIMERLAVQAVLALKLQAQTRERQYAVALLESHQRAQQELLVHDLRKERLLRERAEESEREMRRTLAFRESAVRDEHHRVKNTLQIAASVLSLHARSSTSEAVRLALRDSEGRLRLLAKAHEVLHNSAGSTEAIAVAPLLDGISEALRHSFTEVSARVTLQVSAETIQLPVDEAIAIALLTNEAVTNAYKHAFPGDRCGTVTVALQSTPEGEVTLRIADDGIGLPEGTTGGLGLRLVRTFAAQLRGVLGFSTSPDASGTAITLTVPAAAHVGTRPESIAPEPVAEQAAESGDSRHHGEAVVREEDLAYQDYPTQRRRALGASGPRSGPAEREDTQWLSDHRRDRYGAFEAVQR